MKHLFIILIFFSSIYACTGDCLTCHPKLVPTINTDKRHKPMLSCIECHSAEPNAMAECGDDCFGCHPMKKINDANVRQHDVIQTCIDCHVNADKELMDISNSFDQSHTDSLKDFLNN